jgi:hypothetical protein
MLEIIKDVYDFIMPIISTGFLIVILFYWIVLMIDKKQEKDFDTKYRESRKD